MAYFKDMLKDDRDNIIFNIDEIAESVYYSGVDGFIDAIYRTSIYPETGENADYLIVKIEDVRGTIKNKNIYFLINGIERKIVTSNLEEINSIIAKVRLQTLRR